MTHAIKTLAIAALAGLAACAVPEMPDSDEGRALFIDNCAQCHGLNGQGAGPWVAELGRKPPDLTTLYARGFDRAQVLSVIDGYSQQDVPGRVMPEWGLLLRGDTVPVDIDGTLTPVPRPLAAVLAYLEEIQQ